MKLHTRLSPFAAYAALLTACSGNASMMSAPASLATHADRSPQQQARRAATPSKLLYISDGGAHTAHIYSYPQGRKLGTLTNLGQPAGVCDDAAGNVWIVNSGTSEVLEYAHGGTKPVATHIIQGAGDLYGCAVDPSSGNLAVTDLGNPHGGGGVWIFAGAVGRPKEYQNRFLPFVYFCAYDTAGNLYFDGIDAGKFKLARLPSGGSVFQTIKLNKRVGFPGGLQWAGTNLALGDQRYGGADASAVYQVSISGSSGQVVGTTQLTGSCDVLQFHIAGGILVAPDACKNDVKFYAYPAGGAPTRIISHLEYPVAATLSVVQGDTEKIVP
ncbi:MAG: hypothetical protein JOZ77_12730 [Candidatus Eremiobacteraeota bacterium]|nr:hypothetical protein [Candidatus Eremiobacteraeota bacterium]